MRCDAMRCVPSSSSKRFTLTLHSTVWLSHSIYDVHSLTCNRKLCDHITSENQNVFRYIGHTFHCKSFPVISDVVLPFIFDSSFVLSSINPMDMILCESREERGAKTKRLEKNEKETRKITFNGRIDHGLSVCLCTSSKVFESRCSRSSCSSSSCYYYCLSLGYKYVLLWVIFRSLDHFFAHFFV